MHLKPFSKFLSSLERLTEAQKQLTIETLTKQENQILARLSFQIEEHPKCPHCSNNSIVKFGKANGRQRFRCKGCLKTFVCTRGSAFFYQHHRDQWLTYLQSMLESKKLKDCAKECGITLKTSFHWRHRYMKMPDTTYSQGLEGVVEADETYFRYSQKGEKKLKRPARRRGEMASSKGLNHKDWVPVLVALDRSHHEFDCILKPVNAKNIEHALKDKLATDSVLCTDGQPAYNLLCEHLNIEHIVLQKARIQGSFHIQHVNAYHQRLKTWHRDFKGVATKYLSKYLGWFRMLEWHKYEQTENLLDFSLLAVQQHKRLK